MRPARNATRHRMASLAMIAACKNRMGVSNACAIKRVNKMTYESPWGDVRGVPKVVHCCANVRWAWSDPSCPSRVPEHRRHPESDRTKNTFRKMLELIFFSSKIRHTRQNKKNKNRSTNLASCPVANAAHDALDTFHPNFQFHGGWEGGVGGRDGQL